MSLVTALIADDEPLLLGRGMVRNHAGQARPQHRCPDRKEGHRDKQQRQASARRQDRQREPREEKASRNEAGVTDARDHRAEGTKEHDADEPHVREGVADLARAEPGQAALGEQGEAGEEQRDQELRGKELQEARARHGVTERSQVAAPRRMLLGNRVSRWAGWWEHEPRRGDADRGQ